MRPAHRVGIWMRKKELKPNGIILAAKAISSEAARGRPTMGKRRREPQVRAIISAVEVNVATRRLRVLRVIVTAMAPTTKPPIWATASAVAAHGPRPSRRTMAIPMSPSGTASVSGAHALTMSPLPATPEMRSHADPQKSIAAPARDPTSRAMVMRPLSRARSHSGALRIAEARPAVVASDPRFSASSAAAYGANMAGPTARAVTAV